VTYDYLITGGVASSIVAFIVVSIIIHFVKRLQEAEEALRESEARFRSVVQSANDAIILANSRGNIMAWNKGAQAIFGYREEEVLGKPLSLLMPERYRDAHRRGLERMRSTGESHVIGKTVEFYGLRKDGSEFPLELSLATWKAGEERFYSGIIRDITERKRAEESQRLAAIEERNWLARELHDSVTQSLYSLTLFARTAHEQLARDPVQARTALEHVLEEAKNAFAEMRALLLQLRPTALAEEGLMEALRKHIETLQRRHGLEVQLHGPERLPLTPDAGETLYRVAQEALANVIKHAKIRRAALTLEVAEAEVKLAVTDDGIGFDPQAVAGMDGLGLASMRERIHMIGGTFSIYSMPGGGTQVRAAIPVRQE